MLAGALFCVSFVFFSLSRVFFFRFAQDECGIMRDAIQMHDDDSGRWVTGGEMYLAVAART